MERTSPLINFAGGLLTKKLFGRVDLATHGIGMSILRNFLVEVQGPLNFRSGSKYVLPTRLNGITCLIPFVFNDSQAYALAFSDGKMRVLSQGGVITEAAKTITGITKANPGVITSNGHGYSTGDQIFIDDIEGMTELNGKFYIVTYINVNTYSLKSLDGVTINSTSFTAYTSGGTTERVYEITSQYAEEDLFQIKYAQKADLMYIVHPDYAINKLRRYGETDWRLETFTRTADPFTTAVTAITKANPCQVTATGHGLITGDLIDMYGVGGMTEVNGVTYEVVYVDANNITLKDPITHNAINSTGYNAYTSGGSLFKHGDMPGAVAFYGGRLFYGGTANDPESFWGSRAPTDAGEVRFDDFTLGTAKDDAVTFPIASQNNTADRIHWFCGTNKFLSIGTYGGMYKAHGATESAPITGTDISVQAVDNFGVQSIMPIRGGTNIYYVQRGGLVLNRFGYSLLDDSYSSEDLNTLADEITVTGLKQLTFQQGRLNVLWAVRNDGVLLGLSTKEQEKIGAWHTHYIGGTDAKVLSICGEPQPTNVDNLWVVVERNIDGVTRRYIEYFETDPVLPEQEDFFTGDSEADNDAFTKRTLELMKQFVKVDSSLTLDTSQVETLTPGAVTGTGVTFTAGGSMFTSSDIGRFIYKKSTTGYEYGVAEITSVTSDTQVVCDILEDFDSTDLIDSGNWYLTVTQVNGLDHLEGEEVTIVTDCSVHPVKTVTNGSITLDYPATVIHVGLPYIGWIKSMPLNPASVVGNPMTRTTITDKVGILFRNSLGVEYGTSEYMLEPVIFRTTNDRTDNPPPLFTGVEVLVIKDVYESEKFIHIMQQEPLPCTIQAIIPYINVTEE